MKTILIFSGTIEKFKHFYGLHSSGITYVWEICKRFADTLGRHKKIKFNDSMKLLKNSFK